MKYYIIYEIIKGKKYIKFIDKYKEFADEKETQGLKYVHWNCKTSGPCPKKEYENDGTQKEWKDKRTKKQKRRDAKIMEIMYLKIEALEDIRENLTAPDIAHRKKVIPTINAINKRYP